MTTCLGCGCACDDITLELNGALIVEAKNACSLGAAWFGDGTVPMRVRARDRDCTVEEALDESSRLLLDAAKPLIYLAPEISCEAQREGVAIADVLHAALDSVTSSTAMGSVLAAQERGRASATLGEIRNRADVVVFWGIDPSDRYPRYWSRYAPEPVGIHVPDGRRSRTVVAVDIGDMRGPGDCDVRVSVSADEEVTTLTALTAIVSQNVRRTPDTTNADAVSGFSRTTAAWTKAQELAQNLLAGRYVAIVADAEATEGTDPGRAEALIALSQALNGPTRCALSSLRAGGNRSGADAVMTWQAGYPASIDFAQGVPRYRPHDGTASNRLSSGQVDAILVLGAIGLVPAALRSLMRHVPAVVIGPRASEAPLDACVAAIDTGIAGIHEGGTALRMDDVPLPLRAVLNGPPSAPSIARSLCGRLYHERRTRTPNAEPRTPNRT